MKVDTTTPITKATKTSNKDSSAKLFEEIKVMFQDLPSRIQSNINPDIYSRKKRRFHPMMMKEMMHMSSNNKFGILFGLGMLREGMPWLYDIGMETLRIIDGKDSDEDKERALLEFQDLAKMSTRHPMMEEFLDSKSDFMLYEDLPRMLVREMERYMYRSLNKKITKQ